MQRQYFTNHWRTPISRRQTCQEFFMRRTYKGSLSSISLYIAKTFVFISVSGAKDSASK